MYIYIYTYIHGIYIAYICIIYIYIVSNYLYSLYLFFWVLFGFNCQVGMVKFGGDLVGRGLVPAEGVMTWIHTLLSEKARPISENPDAGPTFIIFWWKKKTKIDCKKDRRVKFKILMLTPD